jgi:hypothetical protein
MVQTSTLDIRGYRDEPVPNTLFRQDGGAHQIGILLPGLGYTVQMPYFWYIRRALLDRGADVLTVEYAYGKKPEFRDWGAEQEEWFYADVTAAGRVALEHQPYERMTLVGKSLGTMAMGHLLGERVLDADQAIWLTPLLSRDDLRSQIRDWGGSSLFAIGTADPEYDPISLAEVCEATCGESVVIKDADHSLDVVGDVIASVRGLERLADRLEAFLTK